MNGRHARKLRKLSSFNPRTERYYHQFDNSHNYVLDENGRLKKGPGTVIEVSKDDEAVTTRAHYKHIKRKYYGRSV